MSAQLSKLHVRFIQSQKDFSLLPGHETKGQKFPISRLYVKDNSHLYLINLNEPIHEDQPLRILFNESTHALNTLECTVDVKTVEKGSEAYEDALLFFHTDTQNVTQLMSLNIQALKEN